MRIRSLAVRLFLSAALWSAFGLALAGFTLSGLYRTSVERTFDARLEVYLQTIVGYVSNPAADQSMVGDLGEPRFGQPLSGWYWMVREPQAANPAWGSSPSLFGEILRVPAPPTTGEVSSSYERGPGNATLRVVTQRLTDDNGRVYDVAVTGNADEISAEIASFRNRVFLTLLIFGIGLVMASVLQVRYGLRPLDRMRAALAAIRAGRAERLEGAFPSEIEPLATELNALIDANRVVVERSRTHVGNLAHALKTPLAVITNEARQGTGAPAERIAQQAGVMREQIDHYLDRARLAAQHRVIGGGSEVAPTVASLAKVMNLLHRERGLSIETEVPGGVEVRAQKAELEEMIGNLMDNACKWTKRRVRVRAMPTDGKRHGSVDITVEDDGPGLPEGARVEALRRGKRLDETVPGSGLGLSIVEELVSIHGGRFTLENSELGGLLARISLPVAG